ncbi:hypothetical protein [Bacteroides cellulosilyticus]|uniref:hypothetical protein n=1 Tax=Bacteroides cellulosilyticus TaxID=246787 RepID=UPI00189FE68F|nr:hypothetical protein [Bacteroides cellulosilyticus]
MEEKKENSKSRFLEFLNSIGISQYKCAQMCGWASGYLTGLKGDFGADKLATMMSIFPQLNIVWIINGKGEMFNSDTPKNEEVKEASKEQGSTIPFDMFMQTTNNYNKIIAEKDAEINALRQEVEKLKNK